MGPHSTSTLYVEDTGSIPTAVTGRLGGMLKTSDWHGPRFQDLPPSINPQRRPEFHFEYPVFSPNMLLHVCAGSGYPGMVYFHHQFWPLGVGKTIWEGTQCFRPPRTPSERIAIAHTNALHRNAWLKDTGTMEDTWAALSSGVLTEMPLMDEEIMLRHADRHWHAFIDTP
jgi:hypothetical protein